VSSGLTLIAYTDTIPTGSSVVCVWPDTTPLPGEDALKSAVEPFGDPFFLSYLELHHVGVKTTEETTALAIAQALASATSGNAPKMGVLAPGLEDIVDAEMFGEWFREGAKEIGKGAAEALVTPLKLASSMPFIIGTAVVGALVIGIGLFLYLRKKEK
jgi:hypothetical protein